ncbi:protein XNDC1N isoform X2 [Hemicordylus capensis]|uniref:protein XNDC1N isoform X2 n=1 Tax=Hemicordylus capensis TaxID=884348 RepID=UPI0023048C09|nr:protein XNDC1N isoform X2 [Hemicordylus capensis]XP_053164009.1 protein XNDC1N isoform X2 [Hemicordylus capensis]
MAFFLCPLPGNCGSAFLQIDVGRSSWPVEQSYLTLLPTATLMVPADAKLGKNRSGVRMFKEGDFLAPALGEKWDRIRLTCSQPFNRHAQFGLSFIRIRTPLDAEDSKSDLPSSQQASPELTGSPWLSNASFCRTFFPEVPSSSKEEEAALRSRLQQLDPGSPGARSPACLSRPAQMVLKAASAHKRVFPLRAASTLPTVGSHESGQDPQRPEGVAQSCVALRTKQELSARRERVKKGRRRGLLSCMGRSVAAASARPKDGSQREGRSQGQKGRLRKEEEEENWLEEAAVGMGTCPICAGCFPIGLLPDHASSCGEENFQASSSSSSSWEEEEPREAWVHCPICQCRFPPAAVEAHASTCGEPPEGPPSWLWLEEGESV